jgi:hypothetical protein
MAEFDYRIDESRDHGDLEKAVDLLKRLYNLKRYTGFVKETVKSGILKINVPVLGLQEILCYVTWEGTETYEKDARIIVSVDQESLVAFILPPELPRTPGKFKVLQNIDDSDPPTMLQDWVRFRSGLFGDQT